jgi:cytochrome d ubiquinol oxidase subunit I
VGTLNGNSQLWGVRVPDLLSLIATLDPHGTVQGINNVQRAYEKKYGPGDYKPYIPVTYWSFRLMAGFGSLATLFSLAGLWLTRRRRIPRSRWFYRAAIAAVATPYLASTMGWIFTEMGRQPWTVFGVLQTSQSVSPGVSAWTVATSLVVFTLLYGGLGAVAGWLMIRSIKPGRRPSSPRHPGPGPASPSPSSPTRHRDPRRLTWLSPPSGSS